MELCFPAVRESVRVAVREEDGKVWEGMDGDMKWYDYDSFVEASKKVMQDRNRKQQQEVVREVLFSVLPPGAFAQVRVVTRKICGPLEEDAFRPILHHYDGPKSRLELSVPEALALLDIFAESSEQWSV